MSALGSTLDLSNIYPNEGVLWVLLSDPTLGIMTAVAEPDLARQQADGLQETLSRAYGGSAVVSWVDEVEPPEDE